MKWTCHYRHQTSTGPEQGTFVVEAERSVEATIAAYAKLGELRLGDGLTGSTDVELRVMPEDGAFERPMFVVDSEARPGKVICCAILPVILAGLSPEESWKLLGFLFAIVLLLLCAGFAVVALRRSMRDEDRAFREWLESTRQRRADHWIKSMENEGGEP